MRHHIWNNKQGQVIHEIKIAPDGAVFGIDGKPFENIGTFKTDKESEQERKKRLGRGHAYLYYKNGEVSRHVDFLSKVYWEKNQNE